LTFSTVPAHPPTIIAYQFRPSVLGVGSKLNPHPGVSRTPNCDYDCPGSSEAPQTRAGVLPVEDHREALLEHDGAGGFSLELACCQSRVFGKLGPNAPGHFTPTAPDSLNDHGDERDALGQAFRTRILVAGFEILVPTGDTVRVGSISVQAQAEATGDREIPSGRRAKPPPRDVHVSRTPRPWPGVMLVEDAAILVSGTQQRPLREQAGFLQLRPMIGRLGSVIHHVAQQVVSTRAVAATTANQRVVTIPIQDAITERAFSINIRETYPQPPPKRTNEQRRLGVEASRFAGGRVPVRTGALADQVEVIAARLAGIVSELRQGSLVDTLGQRFLGKLVGHGRQPVIVIDTLVVGAEGHTFGSKLRASRGLEGVFGVKFLAQLHATAAGGEESSMAVLGQRPEAKPPTVSAQRRLSPLLVVGVETGEVLKARPDLVVKRTQGSGVEAGRHSSDREDHFAERGAVTKELQSDLGSGRSPRASRTRQALLTRP
jgi:hypothetical protein